MADDARQRFGSGTPWLQMRREILLVPIGEVEANLTAWLVKELEAVLGRAVRVGEAVPLPESGHDPRRRQCLGDAMLAVLRAVPGPAERVMGLTNADCYAPGLNFIFGQAVLHGREAFVALPRLRQVFYGLPDDPSLFRQRVLKETVHELGHTWGLGHCPDRHCVMHFSNTLYDTDVKGASFCSRCWKQLSRSATTDKWPPISAPNFSA